MKSKDFDLDFARRERYTYTKIISSQGKVPGKSFGGSNTMSVALNTKHLSGFINCPSSWKPRWKRVRRCTVQVYHGETLLGEYEVKAAADAPRMDFGTAFSLLWGSLTG